MTSTPIISLVVPVYNTSRYLRKCLESIRNQAFSKIEVLLIDDGSTDDSIPICQEFVANDSRFKLYCKENGGVSSARNFGISKAKGDWLLFVDSDDELMAHGIEKLYSNITDEVEMVMAGYEEYDDFGNLQYAVTDRIKSKITIPESIRQLFSPTIYKYQGFLWNKLLKNSVISVNNLRFDESIYYNEDRLFLFFYLQKCSKSVIYITDPVYKYIHHRESAMACLGYHYNKKFLTDIDALAIMLKEAKRNNFASEVTKAIRWWLSYSYGRIRQMMKKSNMNNIRGVILLHWYLFRSIGLREYCLFLTKK